MEHHRATSSYILPAEEMFRDSYVSEESKSPVVRETTLMGSMMSILSTGRTDTEYHCLDSASVSCDHVTASGSSAANQTREIKNEESLDVNNNNHPKKEEKGAPLIHIYPEGFCEGTAGGTEHPTPENQTLPFTLSDNQTPGLAVFTLSPEGASATVNQSTPDTSVLSGYHSSPCMTANQAWTSQPYISTLFTTPEKQLDTFSPVLEYQSVAVGQIMPKDSKADKTDPSSPARECQSTEVYSQIETQSTKKARKPQTKPPYSCIAMITMAIQNAPDKKMTLREIYAYISSSFPYFSDGKKGWQNTVRFNLSRNDCFIRVKREKQNPGKGSYWALHPECGDMFKDGCFLRRNRKFRVTRKQEKEGEKVDSVSNRIAGRMKMPTVDAAQSFMQEQMTSHMQLPQCYTPTYVQGHRHDYTNYYQLLATASQHAHTELSHQSHDQPSHQMLTPPGFSAYNPAWWHSPLYYQNWQ